MALFSFAAAFAVAGAAPVLGVGDARLRHDVQLLADHGVLKGPVTTWPLGWGPLLEDLDAADLSSRPAAIRDAAARLLRRGSWETRTDELTFDASLGIADNRARIRGYSETPRGRVAASVGVNFTADRFSLDLNAQYADDAGDSQDLRFDDSMLGVALGNWTIAASTMQRWWGPGQDGSIILSNNARPIPSLTIDRNFTDPFESRWLSWLGPWDVSVQFGQMESDRAVPNARFFGMRFNFRPLESLELGLSRTAQWCGDGRPCDAETFFNLMIGRDNRGGEGIGLDNEPGNQLAGFDARWTPPLPGRAIGVYAQVIGEDEAGGFPSRYLGQVGVDWSGYLLERWSAHGFVEYSGTACQFHESSKLYNCGYDHGIYQTGYRFRGRSIGHGADNDAELVSIGFSLADVDDTEWRALVRFGNLNDGGAPDPGNTVTATPQEHFSIDLAHRRAFRFGIVEVGAGLERIDDPATGSESSEGRLYLLWRSSY